MPERISSRTPLEMTPGCVRIPDGHIVPQPPPPEQPPQLPAPTRYHWLVFWSGLAVVALGVTLGVLQ